MKPSTKLRCLRYSTLTGCFFSLFAGSVTWYWGNLRVYTDSYFRAKLGPDSGYDTPWVVALSVIAANGGIIFSDMTGKSLDRRLKIGVASVIFILAIGLNYFTVQKSVAALVFLCGPVTGFFSGYVTGIVLVLIRISCDQKQVGFYTGAVTSAAGVAPLMFNQIIPFYINPDNQATNLRTDKRAYFTQDDILDRVPSVFLILSGVTLSSLVLGLPLIRDTSYERFVEEDNGVTATGEDVANHYHSREKSCGNQMEHGISEVRDGCGKTDQTQNGDKSHDFLQIKQIENTASESKFRLCEPENNDNPQRVITMNGKDLGNDTNGYSERNTSGDLSPRELLKTSAFYIMYFSVVTCAFCFNVMANYVKVYGQLWTGDDHFLATLETVILIGYITVRILGGLCVDKFGFKYFIIIEMSIISIGMGFLYFTVMVDKWFYFVWAAVTGAFIGAFFFIYSIGALKVFGFSHYIKNAGLLIGGGSLPVSLFGPYLINCIIQNAGWFPLFFTCSALTAVSLISIVIFFPKSEKY